MNRKTVMNSAGYVSAYLCASLIGGMMIGYLLDKYFATKPFFFIIFFLLGFVASIFRIYKLMMSVSNAEQPK